LLASILLASKFIFKCFNLTRKKFLFILKSIDAFLNLITKFIFTYLEGTLQQFFLISKSFITCFLFILNDKSFLIFLCLLIKLCRVIFKKGYDLWTIKQNYTDCPTKKSRPFGIIFFIFLLLGLFFKFSYLLLLR
jgi:hypothetical protein